MLKLLIASLNKDKISEIRELLAELDLELYSLRDYPDLPTTDEDQDTIRGNAMKKALEAAQRTGLLALADDTGLFIKALNDEPGVYAARFAGEHCSYKDNRVKALLLMQDISERYAEFRTCCALAAPDGIVAITEGCLPGLISKEERGENGFGYDSIFEPDPGGRTYAEMTDSEKNGISHRALALRKMLPILQDIITLR